MSRKKTTKKRKSYVANPAPRRRRRAAAKSAAPRRRRSYRKNPESLKDTGLMLAAGVGSAVVAGKLAKFVPGSNLVKNLVLVAAGGATAYLGRRNPLLVGAGAGLAIVGASNAIKSAVPALAGELELTQDEQAEAIAALSNDQLLGAPLEGEYFGAPLAGEYFGAPLQGDMNTPSM